MSEDKNVQGFSEWRTEEHLQTPEARKAFMDAALAEGDPELLQHCLGIVARSAGMSKVAREAGLSRESLYRALSPDGNPTLKTVSSVLAALGLRLSVACATEGGPEAG